VVVVTFLQRRVAKLFGVFLSWFAEQESSRAVDAILEGMSSVIPLISLRLFGGDEVETMICGKPTIDIGELLPALQCERSRWRCVLLRVSCVCPVSFVVCRVSCVVC
jgi:hypothetical protein